MHKFRDLKCYSEDLDGPQKLYMACRTIAEDVKIKQWLEHNDPMALRQVRKAIAQTEGENHAQI